MPLELLLILVIGGIAAIAVLLHLTGRSNKRVLSAAAARAAWQRQFPESRVSQLVVADNGHAALIRDAEASAPLGLVWSFGADTVARTLQDIDLARTNDGLRLSFADYSAPRVLLHLTPTETNSWQQMIADHSAINSPLAEA